MNTIISALVGSQAHGLADEYSDKDYRGVFVEPTENLLSLGVSSKQVKWIEGGEDDTAHELGKFLHLATQSNPTVLEVFWSPEYPTVTEEGQMVLDLFDEIWDADRVYHAFRGYSKNQEKKFLEDHMGRRWKYAVAKIRTYDLAIRLFETGKMPIRIEDEVFKQNLRSLKSGAWRIGEAMDWAEEMRERLERAYKQHGPKHTNMDAVNDVLLTIRRNNWV